MPSALVCLTWLTLAATPVEGGLPDASTVNEEAEKFARQLVSIAANINAQYVRPISLETLLFPAVEAVYHTAREPVPSGFRADLRQASAAFQRGEDLEIVTLIARCRQHLGPREALAEPRATLAALKAMGQALDPYSGLVAAGAFVGRGDEPPLGVGFEIGGSNEPLPTVAPNGPWRVTHVVPGSPAQLAGLRPQDLIVGVENKPADNPEAAVALTRLVQFNRTERPAFSSSLTIQRPGLKSEFAVIVHAGPYEQESVWGVRRRTNHSWDFWADPSLKLAHVRIGGIGPNTPDQLREVLRPLQADGMRGLLLDLRWNPGGYLRQSADIARLFLKEGEIARVDSPNPRIDKADFRADDPGAEFADVPLVVLINGQTSGGGELIAAALQDNKRAVIAGLRSIGKASIQQQLTNGVPIPGWDFKLTSGYFLRPSMHGVMPESAPEIGEASMTRRNNGRPFLASPWGVSPNAGYELPISPEMDQRLKLMWTLQTLRPGGDSSALPLDDPEADPQRQAALALLAKLLPTK